jgi:hypothetical protein
MQKVQNKSLIKEVPCNGCTLCCRGDVIRIEDEEKAADYKTEPHPFLPGALMLAHKPDGECIYLAENGCSIHNNAPLICRMADCRSIALRFDFKTARKLHALNKIDIRVWDQGRRLLEKNVPRNN